jgi:hypothetical protein
MSTDMKLMIGNIESLHKIMEMFTRVTRGYCGSLAACNQFSRYKATDNASI